MIVCTYKSMSRPSHIRYETSQHTHFEASTKSWCHRNFIELAAHSNIQQNGNIGKHNMLENFEKKH
jgi:hypothetical protein